MERALGSLNDALAFSNAAASDKGGQRMAAMRPIQQAMGDVQAGIDYTAENYSD